MPNAVICDALNIARANANVAGFLLRLKCDLYQSPIAITPETPVGDFTAAVATYHGYAQKVITWGTATRSDDGTIEVIGTMTAFQPTDGVVPNVIWGAFFRDAVSGALLFAGQLDNAPLPMNNALDQIRLTFRFRPGGNSRVEVIS